MNIFEMNPTILKMQIDEHDNFMMAMYEFYDLLNELDEFLYPGSLKSFSFSTAWTDPSKNTINITYKIFGGHAPDENGHLTIPLEWLYLGEETLTKIVHDNKAERIRKKEEEANQKKAHEQIEIEEHERVMLASLLKKYEGKEKYEGKV